MTKIQLRYGMQKYSGFEYKPDGDVIWYDSAREAIDAHVAMGYPHCTIYVYGLGARLTYVTYLPWGAGAGYSIAEIHNDMQELCAQNGITKAVIWKGCFRYTESEETK